jgi:glycosyltransferase involved in cell wall biosynthesis
MKKKVLFYMFNLSGGGAERTVVNILNHLNKEEIEPILVLGSNDNNEYLHLLDPNIRIVKLGCLRAKHCLFKLRSVIIKEEPDTIFTTLNFNNILLILARILIIKKINTVVRVANNHTQAGNISKTKKFTIFLLYNLFADRVIALSIGVKNDLADNFRIKKDKIKVIYNPVDVSAISKQSLEKVDDFTKYENEKIVIAVGSLEKQKDFETLINAFKIVSVDVPLSRLIILGKGTKESELKQLTINLKINDKVEFLGFKKNPYKYMKKADVFVLSSKWEGFGHVIVESMATGTPVISTNCESGPSEIIGNNKFGLLVPVEDHVELAKGIIELLNNDNKRESYAASGIKRALNFNAKNITKEYEKIL